MLIISQNNTIRTRAIENLPNLIKVNEELCSILKQKMMLYLQSNNSQYVSIAIEALNAISDLNLNYFEELLNPIINAIGTSSRDIQGDLAKLILLRTKSSHGFIQNIINGLESSEWNIRRVCASIIYTLLREEDIKKLDLQNIVNHLVPLLKDASFSVVEQTIRSISLIREDIGDKELELMIQPSLRHIYSSHRDKIYSSKNSSDITNIEKSVEIIRPKEETKVEKRRFGFLPNVIESDLSNLNWNIRCHAAEKFAALIKEVPKEILLKNFNDVCSFIAIIFEDPNLKVKNTMLKTLSNIIEIIGDDIIEFIGFLIEILIDVCNTSKKVIRKACSTLFLQIIEIDPITTLESILKFSNDKRQGVLLEVYEIIVIFLINHRKRNFDSDILFVHLRAGLDSKFHKVKHLALEAFAVFANVIKPRDSLKMFSADEDINIIELVKERLNDKRLPFLNFGGDLETTPLNTKSQRKPNGFSSIMKLGIISSSEKTLNCDENFENVIDDLECIESAFDTIEKIGNDLLNADPSTTIGSNTDISRNSQQKNLTNIFTPKKSAIIGADLENVNERYMQTKAKSIQTMKRDKNYETSFVQKQNIVNDKKLRELLNEAQDQEWDIAQKALVEIDDAIPYHVDWFCQNISEVSIAITKQVQNLRSTVSKISIISLAKLFKSIPKQTLEPHLDLLVKCLLRKVGEGNSFILEEIDLALDIMAENVTLRGIIALIAEANSKHSQIRMRISVLIDKILSRFGKPYLEKIMKSQKDMERILPCLLNFSSDGLVETRNAAKHAIFVLSKTSNFVK